MSSGAGGSLQSPAWTADVGMTDDEVGLLTRLVRLNMVVTQVLDQLVGVHGSSVADFLVLATVRRGISSPAELCEVLGRTTGGMSLTIDRLVGDGLVQRRPDPVDRRRIVVELTEAGRQRAEAVNRALHDWEAGMDLDEATRTRIETHIDEVTQLVTRHRP